MSQNRSAGLSSALSAVLLRLPISLKVLQTLRFLIEGPHVQCEAHPRFSPVLGPHLLGFLLMQVPNQAPSSQPRNYAAKRGALKCDCLRGQLLEKLINVFFLQPEASTNLINTLLLSFFCGGGGSWRPHESFFKKSRQHEALTLSA